MTRAFILKNGGTEFTYPNSQVDNNHFINKYR